jgi:hypothetical protein
MATSTEVLEMLIPQGGWVTRGQSYEDLEFIDCEPISKKEFEDGFAKYDAWSKAKEAEKETKRQALLDRLGITAEEAKLLLS